MKVKRTVWWGIAAATLLVLTTAAFSSVIPSLRRGGPLLALAVRAIEAASGARIELGDTVVNWREGTLSAGPVVVHSGTDGAVFTARALRLRIDTSALWQRRVLLDHVRVEQPSLRLRLFDGDIPGLTDDDRSPSGWTLQILDLSVDGGSIEVEVEPGPVLGGRGGKDPAWQRAVAVHLGAVSARLTGDGAAQHALALDVGQVRIEGVEGLTALDPIRVELWITGAGLLAPERVAFTEVRLASSDLSLSVSGTLTAAAPGHDPVIDVDIDGTANLTTLGAALGVPVSLSGGSTGQARLVSGGATGMTLVGDIDITELVVGNKGLGTLHSRFHADQRAVELSDATWWFADSVIRASAQARLVEGVPFEVEASTGRLSAYRLFAALGISSGPWVDARVEGGVRASGRLAPFVLDGTGKGTVSDLVVASSDVMKATQRAPVISVARPVNADVAIHADLSGLAFSGRVDDELTIATGSCWLSFDVSRGLLLDISAPQASMASVGNRIGALAITGRGSGTLHVEGPYAEPMITAVVQANDLTVMELRLGDVHGQLRADPPVLEFVDVAARKGSSRYTGDMSLDFGGSATRRPPYLVLAVVLADAQAEDLRSVIPETATDPGMVALRTLNLVGPVGGHIDAEGPAGAERPEQMRGNGVVVAKRGARLFGQEVTGGNVRFHFNRGVVVVDQVGVGP